MHCTIITFTHKFFYEFLNIICDRKIKKIKVGKLSELSLGLK